MLRVVTLVVLVGCAGDVVPPPVPAAVVARDAAPRRQNPPGTAIATRLVQGRNAYVGALVLAPGAKVPEHQDPTEEYLVVVRGGGTLTIDGATHRLAAGDAVLMPAGATVSYENGPDETEVLQVFAGPGPAAKYDAWKLVDAAP